MEFPRAQIMAYRLLARNQPVPPHVGMAAQGKRADLPPQPNAGLQGDQQQQQQQMYGPSSQPGQPFQRPPAPAAPLSSMQRPTFVPLDQRTLRRNQGHRHQVASSLNSSCLPWDHHHQQELRLLEQLPVRFMEQFRPHDRLYPTR